MRSCNDVCDEIISRLLSLGFELDPHTQDHEQIFAALAECTLVRNDTSICDRVIRKLKEAGFAIPNDHKAHRETLAALEKCCVLPNAEVQVVVALEGGLVQDVFAYTKGALADAKQAALDKQYGLERDADGYVTTESDDQVITYVLPLDKDV